MLRLALLLFLALLHFCVRRSHHRDTLFRVAPSKSIFLRLPLTFRASFRSKEIKAHSFSHMLTKFSRFSMLAMDLSTLPESWIFTCTIMVASTFIIDSNRHQCVAIHFHLGLVVLLHETFCNSSSDMGDIYSAVGRSRGDQNILGRCKG